MTQKLFLENLQFDVLMIIREGLEQSKFSIKRAQELSEFALDFIRSDLTMDQIFELKEKLILIPELNSLEKEIATYIKVQSNA